MLAFYRTIHVLGSSICQKAVTPSDSLHVSRRLFCVILFLLVFLRLGYDTVIRKKKTVSSFEHGLKVLAINIYVYRKSLK